MRNDYKMIVFKQLTISIKTQNDNKIKVYFHVARINKILHYMLNMTINTVGTLNLSTEFGALLVFSVFIATRNPSFVLHVECKGFEVVYDLHHLYIMYSNVKTLSDVT